MSDACSHPNQACPGRRMCGCSCAACIMFAPVPAFTVTNTPDPLADAQAELSRLRAEIDCGQDGVCAKPPGCTRHWEERNRELVAERDEARRTVAAYDAQITHLSDYAKSPDDMLEALTDASRALGEAASDTAERIILHAPKAVRAKLADDALGRALDRHIAALHALDTTKEEG